MEEFFGPLTEEEILFIATIYGEAALSSPFAWLAIASVILNRVDRGEWKKRGLNTVTLVIKKSGFDACTDQNAPFMRAVRLLSTGGRRKEAPKLSQLVDLVMPMYRAGKGSISDIVIYYSPKAQRLLHRARPTKYDEKPDWNWSLLEEVKIPAAEKDDFWFGKYKKAPPAAVVGSDIPEDEA